MADDDVPVDLAHQHHAGNVEGFGVGDPQAVPELRLLAQPAHELADLRPAAVDDHGAHPNRAHEHDVGGEIGQRPTRRPGRCPPYLTTTVLPQNRRM